MPELAHFIGQLTILRRHGESCFLSSRAMQAGLMHTSAQDAPSSQARQPAEPVAQPDMLGEQNRGPGHDHSQCSDSKVSGDAFGGASDEQRDFKCDTPAAASETAPAHAMRDESEACCAKSAGSADLECYLRLRETGAAILNALARASK